VVSHTKWTNKEQIKRTNPKEQQQQQQQQQHQQEIIIKQKHSYMNSLLFFLSFFVFFSSLVFNDTHTHKTNKQTNTQTNRQYEQFNIRVSLENITQQHSLEAPNVDPFTYETEDWPLWGPNNQNPMSKLKGVVPQDSEPVCIAHQVREIMKEYPRNCTLTNPNGVFFSRYVCEICSNNTYRTEPYLWKLRPNDLWFSRGYADINPWIHPGLEHRFYPHGELVCCNSKTQITTQINNQQNHQRNLTIPSIQHTQSCIHLFNKLFSEMSDQQAIQEFFLFP
jgi:hypothetical protein